MRSPERPHRLRRRLLPAVGVVALALGGIAHARDSAEPSGVLPQATATTQAPRQEQVAYKPLKVAVFGDSIVAGFQNGQEDKPHAWPEKIEQTLNARVGQPLVTVENHAVPGQPIISPSNWGPGVGNMVGVIRQTYPEGTDPAALPDVAVVVPSINEFMSTPEGNIETARQGTQQAYALLKNAGVKNVLVGFMLPPGPSEDPKIKEVLGEVNAFNTWLALQSLDPNNPYRMAMLPSPDGLKTSVNGPLNPAITGDGVHLTAQGQDLEAAIYADALDDYLQPAQ